MDATVSKLKIIRTNDKRDSSSTTRIFWHVCFCQQLTIFVFFYGTPMQIEFLSIFELVSSLKSCRCTINSAVFTKQSVRFILCNSLHSSNYDRKCLFPQTVLQLLQTHNTENVRGKQKRKRDPPTCWEKASHWYVTHVSGLHMRWLIYHGRATRWREPDDCLVLETCRISICVHQMHGFQSDPTDGQSEEHVPITSILGKIFREVSKCFEIKSTMFDITA